MSTYVPKVGDRVRVIYEGAVTALGNYGLDMDNDGYLRTAAFSALVSVEKLADPEVWCSGDVVLNASGLAYQYSENDDDWTPANGCDPLPTSRLQRPLTILRGKSVTS